MGTKLTLTPDGFLQLDDGRRSVLLSHSRVIAMGASDLPLGKHIVNPHEPIVRPAEPGRPRPPLPTIVEPGEPVRQVIRPGRPRPPLPTMFQPIDPAELELPGRLLHVARLDLLAGHVHEAWGKSIRRTRPIVQFATTWSDLAAYPVNIMANHLSSQAEQRVVADTSTLNVLLAASDLRQPLDLGAVAVTTTSLGLDLQTVQLYYVPGT
jgi:hypothetical protein